MFGSGGEMVRFHGLTIRMDWHIRQLRGDGAGGSCHPNLCSCRTPGSASVT